MNWQDIINNVELVYASILEDKGFQTWSLKNITCSVSFYELFPLDDIDKIICNILETHGGYLVEETIATILGFNVVDNYDINPKRYADKAELDIFRAIIKPVIVWGLVKKEKESTSYELTELGYKSLTDNVKYKFYTGEKILFENFNIKPSDSEDNLFFPFYSALGISSDIKNIRHIPYEEIKISGIFDIDETDLIKRHKLQSKEQYNIYKSDTTPYFTINSWDVDIRLYQLEDEYYPIIFYNNEISIDATELLYQPENNTIKENKIEWGLYLKLIKDPNAVLNFETIVPFEDLLELDSLIKDTRLVWNDEQLFTLIAERANANQWYDISNHCSIDVLKLYLEKHNEKFNWTSLSLRIDDDFLVQNATRYPWNFEAISAKESISIEVIKTLLLIPVLKEQEWDWDTIMPLLDFEFIKSNIDKVDFELSELTKTKKDDVLSLIAQYPAKNWNWSYISDEYELTFLLDNILNFGTHINLKKAINRAFVSDENVHLFCQSKDFEAVISDAKDFTLKNYSPNQEEYSWTEQLIDLLETTGYLTWESGNYFLGFECNPYINWTLDFFNKYHSKIATQKGFDFVSEHVADNRIVSDFPNFNWNWDKISANSNLILNSEFLLSVKIKLNFNILLSNVSGKVLEVIFDSANILTYLETNQELWTIVTEKFSIEFVRKNIDYNWDWEVLTKRFSSTIKIESLSNPKWIDKWDWKYLTQNLDLAIVSEKLDLYLDYWDWEYLSIKLDKEFVLNNLPNYNDYWDWQILLNKRLEKQDLQLSSHLAEVAACISVMGEEFNQQLWQIITHKFDYNELENLIVQTYNQELFHWDYTYFYDFIDFNPRQYLNENVEFIDWIALSTSKALNKSFGWDKSLYSYKVWLRDILKLLKNQSYSWDFKSLSKLDSINWNDSILNIETEKWDWDYLSEYSSCFKKEKDFIKRFRKFSKYINFRVFSKRTDSDITEELLSKTLNKGWNWAAITANNSIKFSFAFIKEHNDKLWNWQALSHRSDINFDNESFIELSNQDWDWSAISIRTDITFSIELINKLYDKPFNWEIVSKNKTFVPNSKTLSLLKDKTLDWNAISENTSLSLEILWDYRDNLNWANVTKHQVVNISDISFLSRYQKYLDWDYISQSEKFTVSLENLKQFKEKLNWGYINKRNDFVISDNLFEPFADVLDWSIVSQSMKIHFTEELIEKYRNKWDWQVLRKNPQVIEKLDSTLKKYQAEFNNVEFIEQFNQTPHIYHFTHLFNAIDIIKERKILSRNKAEGKFSNAAGNLVARRGDAHDYARFYFRPQTPTQFYNECLGHDSASGYLKEWTYYGEYFSKWKTYYPQAKNLGLPKCPIPVFFKFDLKEVLMKVPERCFYSTGNMQTNWAQVKKISDDPTSLNVMHLYSDVSDYDNYKQYSQQEFLVTEEFDFSKLDSFEIICYNEEYVNLLKQQLGDDPICAKIKSNEWGIFHGKNRKLLFHETESEISITSEYRDSAYLSIRGDGLQNIQILNPENIQKETETEIIAYPKISFTKTEQPIEVHFVDTTIGKRDWLVYKKCADDISAEKANMTLSAKVLSTVDYSPQKIIDYFKDIGYAKDYFTQVRHYTVEKHTILVSQVFEKYFALNWKNVLSVEAFRVMLILHDIGKARAFVNGNKDEQYKYTNIIINEIKDVIPTQKSEFQILLKLLEVDSIGNYFQEKQTLEFTVEEIGRLSDNLNISIVDFFYLLSVYYQCDTASYTKDEGGFPFLESLFQYNNGQKLFNTNEGLLKFSEKHQIKYLDLLKHINNGS